jgi:hypothetical protein
LNATSNPSLRYYCRKEILLGKLLFMRKFIVVSFLLLSATTFGQNIKLDSLSGKYQSEGIVHVDSLTKENLFTKAQEWIALNYKSGKDVIQLADKDNAKIILKGNFTTSMFMKEGYIGHTLIMEFKDGRFRYTYTDFSYESAGSGKMNFESKNMGFKKKIISKTEQNIVTSIESIKKYMVQNSKKNNDW